MGMHVFTTDEAAMLLEAGFHAAWVGDVREGDEIAVALEDGYGEHAVRNIKQMRVTSLRWEYHNYEARQFRMARFIGYDLDGVPHHHSFSEAIGCFINRPDPAHIEGETR